MRIRTAVLDDVPAIASTLQRAFLGFERLYTSEAFAATVSSPGRIRLRLSEGPIWVALQGDVVVGTVSVAPKGDALYIRGMAVDPVARGSGIGRELMKRIEEYANERGFKMLYLSTTPFLIGAIRLYEKCGFVRNEDGPDNLFGTPLFTMEKKLDGAIDLRGRATGFTSSREGIESRRKGERQGDHCSTCQP